MHTPQQQRIFEKLRSRFGTAGTEGFLPPAGAQRSSAFPEEILKTGLHECLGEGPGDFPSVLGFAISAASRAPKNDRPVVILSLKSGMQELGELYGHGFAGFGLDAAKEIAVRVKGEKELLWAAEEIAASAAATVIVMLDAKEKLYGFTASRRLKLRAVSSGSLVFMLRHWSQEGATSAHTRWRIARRPSTREIKTQGADLAGAPQLVAMLERGQGWSLSRWEMGFHAPAGFRVAALLANGASRTAHPARQIA